MLPSMACTNLIVGKNASKDGSVMLSYSADSYGMFIGLYHYPAATHAATDMRKIYDWDTNRYWGEIPEAPVTYNVVGNMNEWQVSIGETTYGGREEMCDSTGIIDYGSLIYIALQRSKTAREALHVMTSLTEKYGYNSEGETFSICDPNEAWIMEMMGQGAGSKGVVWVARRVPDDCICAHANQSRIYTFPQKGKKFDKKLGCYVVGTDCMFSKDCISFARKQGWFSGKDADFSWADAYGKADFGGRRHCDARVWSFFNHWAEGGFDEYLPWALGKDPDAKPMPLWIKPKQKLGVSDMENGMRDHFEGTPLALDKANDPGQGVWDMPYRPTPLAYEVDGVKYFNERPISTQQSGFVFVSQLRSWLPREIGGVFWFANDEANMTSFVPMYCSQTEQPTCFNTPGADALHFSMDNAYWVCNWVSNMVYPRYSLMFPSLQQARDSLDSYFLAQQPIIEQKAKEILDTRGSKACADYLNDYSKQGAERMMKTWKDLAVYLITKFNDMAVKPEVEGSFRVDEDGLHTEFKRSEYGLGATVKRPGFTTNSRKAIAREMGEWYQIPQTPAAK